MTKRLLLTTILGMMLLNAVTYFYAVVYGHDAFYAENGGMENIQALLAIFAGITGLYRARMNNALLRLAGFYFAVLGLSVFLREVDVERLHYEIPAVLIWLGHGIGRNSMLTVLWLTLFWRTAILWQHNVKPCIKPLLHTPTALFMGCSLTLLLLSDLFEKSVFGSLHHVFYEELFELNGYILFVIAALFLKSSTIQAQEQAHSKALTSH